MGLPPGTTGCAVPTSPLQMQCDILINHNKKSAGTFISPRSAATKDLTIATSLGPADLQAAYGLSGASGPSATDGTGETVAVVDAYGDRHIGTDLRSYQSNWDPSKECASSTGIGTTAGCLTVFNQNGSTSPSSLPPAPTGDNGWEDESALDVEMAWAICPNCSIDLFEANSDDLPD